MTGQIGPWDEQALLTILLVIVLIMNTVQLLIEVFRRLELAANGLGESKDGQSMASLATANGELVDAVPVPVFITQDPQMLAQAPKSSASRGGHKPQKTARRRTQGRVAKTSRT
jgi:hypothetical protein